MGSQMSGDIFGDLREWGRIINQIDTLRKSHKLDEHQKGLVRILRFPDNWQLRERVLKSVKALNDPSEELLSKLLDIVTDEGVYHEVRALAGDALSHLITTKCDREPGSTGAIMERRVVEQMNRILDSHQPPVFHTAIRGFMARL